MSLFYRINDNREIEVCKTILPQKEIDNEEFEKRKKIIPAEEFLSRCNPDVRARVEEKLKKLKLFDSIGEEIDKEKEELKEYGVYLDGPTEETFGPKINRALDLDYYVDLFYVGEKAFVVSEGSEYGYPIDNLEEVKQEIMAYGKEVFGEEFERIVEERDLLNFDRIARENFGIKPIFRYQELVSPKNMPKSSDSKEIARRRQKIWELYDEHTKIYNELAKSGIKKIEKLDVLSKKSGR